MRQPMPRTANRLPRLENVVGKLQDFYGRPPRPLATDVLGLAVLESCAYLVDDDRRREVFLGLKKKTGLVPQVLLHARADDLLEVLKPGGMLPEMRLEKLRTRRLRWMSDPRSSEISGGYCRRRRGRS
jgi:hypothetical protein